MIAEVVLWGKTIGAVSQDEDRPFATFQYSSAFARSGIEVSPLVMPLRPQPYEFPGLPHATFKGLPGLLADSLPDRFGSDLIDAWLARQGRPPHSLSSIERLCYIGPRGMGALEFKPATGPRFPLATSIQIDRLVELANQVLAERSGLHSKLSVGSEDDSLRDILRVGTSAGGARAKAVIAWNPGTREVRSGQVKTDPEFEYWILKFDGVRGNRDKELADPLGYGAIEYAYSIMAKAAGISMAPCRLLEENGRRHFMTKRFDRLPGGEKIHMQSLCGLAHYDFNQAGAYSYEQALAVVRALGLGRPAQEEQFRRAAFNVMARNQDDHVKNIAFLMNREGQWSLSPAFDITYSYNPEGDWTSAHQMTLNGKTDHFDREDLLALAKSGGVRTKDAAAIMAQVHQAVERWPEFAAQAVLPEATLERVRLSHRLKW